MTNIIRRLSPAEVLENCNRVLAKAGLSATVQNEEEVQMVCSSTSVFVAAVEAILQRKIEGVVRKPTTTAERTGNCEAVLNELSKNVLFMDLSHISGERIVLGDMVDISNLLELVCALINSTSPAPPAAAVTAATKVPKRASPSAASSRRGTASTLETAAAGGGVSSAGPQPPKVALPSSRRRSTALSSQQAAAADVTAALPRKPAVPKAARPSSARSAGRRVAASTAARTADDLHDIAEEAEVDEEQAAPSSSSGQGEGSVASGPHPASAPVNSRIAATAMTYAAGMGRGRAYMQSKQPPGARPAVTLSELLSRDAAGAGDDEAMLAVMELLSAGGWSTESLGGTGLDHNLASRLAHCLKLAAVNPKALAAQAKRDALTVLRDQELRARRFKGLFRQMLAERNRDEKQESRDQALRARGQTHTLKVQQLRLQRLFAEWKAAESGRRMRQVGAQERMVRLLFLEALEAEKERLLDEARDGRRRSAAAMPNMMKALHETEASYIEFTNQLQAELVRERRQRAAAFRQTDEAQKELNRVEARLIRQAISDVLARVARDEEIAFERSQSDPKVAKVLSAELKRMLGV